MKKSIFLFVMALVMSGASVTIATAQKADGSIFGKGSKVVNLGLGLGGMHGAGYGMRVPPIQGAFEIGIVDNLIKSTGQGAIGIAPTIGYAAWGFEDWTLSDIFLGVKGNFHYQFVPKLDTYAGVQLGYNVVMEWRREWCSRKRPLLRFCNRRALLFQGQSGGHGRSRLRHQLVKYRHRAEIVAPLRPVCDDRRRR